MNLAELLTRSDRVAIRLDDRTLTYAELDDAARARCRRCSRARASSPATASG